MAIRELNDTIGETGEPPAREDVIFTALSNRRRRLVVSVLREADGSLDIGSLATRIAARECGVDPSTVTHKQRKSVYTALHQNHLPKLADAGFVSAEREWVEIGLTDKADVLDSHLRPSDSPQSLTLWPVPLATGLCTTAVVAVFPGSNLSGVVAATVATLCMTCLCYWWYSDHRRSFRV